MAEGIHRRASQMVVGGVTRSVLVYLRSELRSGQRITGPGIVIEPTSTIVIDGGWEGTVAETGDVILTDDQTAPSHEAITITLRMQSATGIRRFIGLSLLVPPPDREKLLRKQTAVCE